MSSDSVGFAQKQDQGAYDQDLYDQKQIYPIQNINGLNHQSWDLSGSFLILRSFDFQKQHQGSFPDLQDSQQNDLLLKDSEEPVNCQLTQVKQNFNQISGVERTPKTKNKIKYKQQINQNNSQHKQGSGNNQQDQNKGRKDSQKHNFPKFVCSQFKHIQRILKNQFKKNKQTNKITPINLYSQFFRRKMIKSSSLQNIKKYLINSQENQQRQKLKDEFKDYLKKCNHQNLDFDILSLQHQARKSITSKRKSLLQQASSRKMKKVEQYVDYLTVILDNLEKGIMKLNHKNQR